MTIDKLFAQLKHPNPHLQNRAMLEIAEQQDENTIPRLMSALDEEDVVYRRACVKTLGVIGMKAVPTIVEALLNDPNPTVRSSCAKALAQILVNYPEEEFPALGIEGLKQGMRDSNPVVHIASVMALGVAGVPALETLIEGIQTIDNPAVAITIVNALSSIPDQRAVDLLSQLAEDDSIDSYVKESAVSALSRINMLIKYKR
ncbi:MAG: HEAT repeat domain-containing protein [Cyanobacteria bacterium J083]|nr:MAG: HEAT repeat domain-containing protein [Cyanobacteria bacterium J083]